MLRWTQRRNIQTNNNTNNFTANSVAPTIPPTPVSDSLKEKKFASVRSNKSSMSTRFKSLLLSVKEELQCSICLDNFQVPRILKCGHCYCTPCLNGIMRCATIKCPTCRQVTKITQSIDELPINYSITSIQDIVNNSNNDPSKQVLLCTTHVNEEIKFYCRTCSEVLCSECLIHPVGGDQDQPQKHFGHSVVTLKQASVKLYQEIESKTKEASVKVEEAFKSIVVLRERLEGLDGNYQGLRANIDDQFDELIGRINKRKKEILEDLEELKCAEEKQIKDELNTIENLKSHTESVIGNAEQLLNGQGDSIRRASIQSLENPRDQATVMAQLKPSQKDVYSLWKDGLGLKNALDELPSVNDLKPREIVNYLQCSFSNTQKVSIEETIASYGKPSLSLEPRVHMQLFIKGVDGRTTVCNMFEWELYVKDLMIKVSDQLKIPYDLLRLYHQGKLLYAKTNSDTMMKLGDYEISSESIIHIGLAINNE